MGIASGGVSTANKLTINAEMVKLGNILQRGDYFSHRHDITRRTLLRDFYREPVQGQALGWLTENEIEESRLALQRKGVHVDLDPDLRPQILRR